jgi:tRNA threonylcarbamoyl adenosine modification protein YjeE
VTPHDHALSASAEATEAAAGQLAGDLRASDVVLLEGDLAAGKTTFVRGLLRGFAGDPEAVSSPSFVLIQSYDCSLGSIRRLHHVDLYRLDNRVADLREVGLSDVLSDAEAVVAVEWPKDTLATWIPTDARVWRVAITIEENDARTIEITAPNG